MPKKLWAILGAYGIWFAVFSGGEELVNGKYWKVAACLILAVSVYIATKPKSG
jgi:hypothetical protein